MTSFKVVTDDLQHAGQQAVTLAQDIANIVASCSAMIEAAGSGNMGFVTVPALGALTVAQFGALHNLGSQLDEQGKTLQAAGTAYHITETNVVNATQQQAQASSTTTSNAASWATTVQRDLVIISQVLAAVMGLAAAVQRVTSGSGGN